MDTRPIGIFDSGLGGLTVVKSVLERLPGENIIYFGDTKRVPYGNRSPETLKEFVTDDINFLLSRGVKAVVIACNTADSVTMDEMKRKFTVPLVGVVSPAARQAAQTTKNGKIGVIATTATIESSAYGFRIRKYNPDARVFGVPCPLLVPLVEEGRVSDRDPVTTDVLRGYLQPLKQLETDTLVLGCTHYPLLRPLIEKLMPGVNIISSGFASTGELIKTLDENGIAGSASGEGTLEMYVSDAPEKFARNGSMFIGREISGLVSKVEVG